MKSRSGEIPFPQALTLSSQQRLLDTEAAGGKDGAEDYEDQDALDMPTHLPGTAEAQTDGQGSAQAQAKTHAQERPERILSSHTLLILALQKQERKARAQCTLSA